MAHGVYIFDVRVGYMGRNILCHEHL